ncbi:MAG: GntR family transcriptional regulator [Caulobacteraceae bacterium]|nr:GntR family transcriptional regulator [Caulobacteraceae bacterium]
MQRRAVKVGEVEEGEPLDGRRAEAPPLHRLLRLREDTAAPLYQQLEDQLGDLIAEGRLPEGTTLPAERRLAEALGVSRATVQRCYNVLRERRLIQGRGRYGTVVDGTSARLLPGMDRLKGFTQEMKELGKQPSTRVLEHEIVADRSIASIFGLPPTARFVKLRRIRLGDETPLSLELAWYSLDAAPFLEDADIGGSIYGQLVARGLVLAYCDQTIEAAQATQVECDVFGFSEPAPCLLIKRRTYLRRGPMV